MTAPAPDVAPTSPAPAELGADPLSAAGAHLLACADRAAAVFNQVVAGTYTSADAVSDSTSCAATTSTWLMPYVDAWWKYVTSLVSPPANVAQPSSRVHGRVDVDARPVTLHIVGFRAIGYGVDYFIHQNDITFEPSAHVEQGADPRFVMNVDWKQLPPDARKRTIVYEGEVTAAETGELVTNPIRFVKPAFSD